MVFRGGREPNRSSKQFVYFMLAGVDQRERPSLRTRQLGFQIETEAVVDRGHDLRWIDRPLGRHPTDAVARANDAAPLHSASGEIHSPTLWPMIASAGWVDARRAAELGQVRDQRVAEHASLG